MINCSLTSLKKWKGVFMEKFQTDTYLNMPDLLFSKFCEEEFKVNKGVYNTIEQWLYNQGVQNIVKRREIILSFLFFIRKSQKSNGKIKFGHGGLTERLYIFWSHYKVAQMKETDEYLYLR